MLYQLCEYLIRRKLNTSLFPKEICSMISEADLLSDPKKVETIARWRTEFPAIQRIIFHIASKDPFPSKGNFHH
jgi:undecaprenyl diphosphate synthase